jgi:hypothetical protein
MYYVNGLTSATVSATNTVARRVGPSRACYDHHVLQKVFTVCGMLSNFVLQGSQQQQGQGHHRLPHHYQVRAIAYVFVCMAGLMFATYQQQLQKQ